MRTSRYNKTLIDYNDNFIVEDDFNGETENVPLADELKARTLNIIKILMMMIYIK